MGDVPVPMMAAFIVMMAMAVIWIVAAIIEWHTFSDAARDIMIVCVVIMWICSAIILSSRTEPLFGSTEASLSDVSFGNVMNLQYNNTERG